MKNKKGILYGVGVGPGDPELLTIKAYNIINETEHIAFPGKNKRSCHSYKIVNAIVPHMEDKVLIECPVEMTKDKRILQENYKNICQKIAAVLDRGENVAFLTIGDPTLYATYMYIHRRIQALGYEAILVNGVASFCAVAARLDISVADRDEQVHIIPSSYDIDEALSLPGTKVLMKASRKIKQVKEKLLDMPDDVYMVENCGMENEKIYRSADEIDENAGYLSLVIVKNSKEKV